MLKKIQIKNHPKSPLLLKGGIGILIATVILEVWMVNRLAAMGGKLNQIKILKSQLELENQLLENKIVLTSSLNNISIVSEQLGLKNSQQVEFYKNTTVASAK